MLISLSPSFGHATVANQSVAALDGARISFC
jgi:hypothetical protein